MSFNAVHNGKIEKGRGGQNMIGRWMEVTENSSAEEKEAFYKEFMEVVDDYTKFPKPRGKGGAQFINECSSSMLSGFEALGRIQRMDWVAEAIDKLEIGKEHLKGPSFEMWIRHIRGRVQRDSAQKAKKNLEQLHELYPKYY